MDVGMRTGLWLMFDSVRRFDWLHNYLIFVSMLRFITQSDCAQLNHVFLPDSHQSLQIEAC